MSVIRHFEASPEERAAYLKQRRLMAGVTEDEAHRRGGGSGSRRSPRTLCRNVGRTEDLILTVAAKGSGTVSSSHDYPVRGRGGRG